jgi:hypothetical protein
MESWLLFFSLTWMTCGPWRHQTRSAGKPPAESPLCVTIWGSNMLRESYWHPVAPSRTQLHARVLGRVDDIFTSGGWSEIIGRSGEVEQDEDTVGRFGVRDGGRRVIGFKIFENCSRVFDLRFSNLPTDDSLFVGDPSHAGQRATAPRLGRVAS